MARALVKNISQSATPTGSVKPFAGSTVPNGWLLCDGSVVSQTTYSELYTALDSGGTWDTGGEGAGNFRLPDLRNRYVRGAGVHGSAVGTPISLGDDQTDSTSAANLGGNADIGHSHNTANTSSTGSHTNQTRTRFNSTGNTLTLNATGNQGANGQANTGNFSGGTHNHSVSVPTHTGNGGLAISGDTETRPLTVGVNYIIKI